MTARDVIELEGIAAAIDTNVLLDIYSIQDLLRDYEKIGGANVDAPELVFRRARARDSLLLIMHFHARSLRIFSLDHEFRRILLAMSPSDQPDDPRYHHTTWFWSFVHKEVLPGWQHETVADCDLGIKGDACDDRLLEIAARNRLPLITNEGLTLNGIVVQGLREKAILAGVPVFTPREFWTGKLDEGESIDFFFQRFDKLAPRFIREQPDPPIVGDSFDILRATYMHVLLGLTEGTDVPARVVL